MRGSVLAGGDAAPVLEAAEHALSPDITAIRPHESLLHQGAHAVGNIRNQLGVARIGAT